MLLSRFWSLVKMTAQEAGRHAIHPMAGALAFFALIGLPSLALVLIVAGGAVFGEQAAREGLLDQVEEHLGPESRATVQSVIANTPRPGEGDLGTQILSVAALLFGATAGFYQLQRVLNAIWDAPNRTGWWRLLAVLIKRLLSFAMIAATGLLVLAFQGMTALLAAFPTELATVLPANLIDLLRGGLEAIVAFLLITVHLALLFKVLPDARVPWRGVLFGSMLTSILLVVGMHGLRLYLERSDLGSPFGTAGSLVVTLVGFYVAALVVLFGAVFIRSYTRWRAIRPAAA